VRDEKTVRIFDRELLLLIALAVTAFGIFVFTKMMATREQQMESRIARDWYERGLQSMASRENETAIADFRRASASALNNQEYALTLADALATGNHDVEAEQLLRQLRESDPENAEINTDLARLLAKHAEISDAVRYYQNALYGRWAGSQIDVRRRQLRVELVGFLIAHGERNLASSELLILQTELPKQSSSWTEAAKLSLETGDLQQALKDYREAAQLDSRNVEALTGEGKISFQLRDYANARQYLKGTLELDPQSSEVHRLLSLTESVLNDDPLAPNLAPAERQRRLVLDFQRSQQNLENCLDKNSGGNSAPGLQSLKTQAFAMQPKLNRKHPPPDSDTVTAGTSLVFSMEKAASDACGEASISDRALVLIGLLHDGGRQ
jgi:Flp pilus assembly protein TadD